MPLPADFWGPTPTSLWPSTIWAFEFSPSPSAPRQFYSSCDFDRDLCRCTSLEETNGLKHFFSVMHLLPSIQTEVADCIQRREQELLAKDAQPKG